MTDKHASRANPSHDYEIYPKRYFKASPSWFTWNKLTAKDVLALRSEPGFEGKSAYLALFIFKSVFSATDFPPGQGIFFHLNHPIQYVSITGMAVQIEFVGTSQLCFITLDDGSSRVLNAKLSPRTSKGKADEAAPSNTLIDNVNVRVTLGAPKLFVAQRELAVGSIVRVRGSLETWRDRIQLVPKRIKFVDSTALEVRTWRETADWKRNVLGHPWVLTDAERRKLDDEFDEADRRAEDRRKRKRKWHQRCHEKKLAAEEKDEAKRVKDQALLDEGALPNSHVIPWY